MIDAAERPKAAQLTRQGARRNEPWPQTCRRSPATMRRISSSSTTTAASARCSTRFLGAQRLPRHRRRLGRRGAPAASPAWHFDLLVVDVMMPGESGLEFTEALRQISDVPILMLTARAEAPAPHPRARGRRRRLSGEALRAARTPAAHQQHPEARRQAGQPRCRVDPLRRLHLPPGARRAEARRRRRSASPTASATCCACSPAAPGETVTRHEFLKVSNGGGERAVDVQINRLRRKIEARSVQPGLSADGARHRLPAPGRLKPQPMAAASTRSRQSDRTGSGADLAMTPVGEAPVRDRCLRRLGASRPLRRRSRQPR